MWIQGLKNIFCFCFCVYKMYLISADGYTNLGVHFLSIKKLMEFGQVWKMYIMG